MKIWAKTAEFSEGKYLVVRRDGTVPPWPHFVIGGYDPCAAFALKAYASEAQRRGLDPEYVASIRELAGDFERLASSDLALRKADPDAGPHRRDNPAVLSMMRGRGDLSGLRAVPAVDPRIAEYAERAKQMSGVSQAGTAQATDLEPLGESARDHDPSALGATTGRSSGDDSGTTRASLPPVVTCPYCARPATVRLEPTEGGGAEWVATCSPCHEHLGTLP